MINKTVQKDTTTKKIIGDSSIRFKKELLDLLNVAYFEAHVALNSFPDEVVSCGISTLVEGDEYNEEIGNEIAFRKAKLKNNTKKLKLLRKLQVSLYEAIEELTKIQDKLYDWVVLDERSLRKYNPDFSVYA